MVLRQEKEAEQLHAFKRKRRRADDASAQSLNDKSVTEAIKGLLSVRHEPIATNIAIHYRDQWQDWDTGWRTSYQAKVSTLIVQLVRL